MRQLNNKTIVPSPLFKLAKKPLLSLRSTMKAAVVLPIILTMCLVRWEAKAEKCDAVYNETVGDTDENKYQL